MKMNKRIISLLLSLMLILGTVTAAGLISSATSSVVLTLDPSEIVTDAGSTAEFTLAVEGLGTDPNNNQIASVVFTSSDTHVADNFSVSAASSYVVPGGFESTGLQYTVSAFAFSTGSATVTATVTDTSNNIYTRKCSVIVKGIVVNPKNITLEVGEACVLFAERFGFTASQSTTNLTWSKTPNSSWITLGAHGSGRQNEAYYVKANSIGTGVVTVSMRGGSSEIYSDTVTVTVVEKKSITIAQNGDEILSSINLNSVGSTAELEALTEGFSGSVITWESSRPDLVSVTSNFNSSATVTRMETSDTIVAVKATATDGTVTRTKTVYVINNPVPSLRIIGSGITTESGIKHITIEEGETVALSALVSGADATATIWSAPTDGGRVPVKLNSTVGKNITITGRLRSDSPVVVTAANEGYYDTVYITVAPSDEKSIRITGVGLGADGVLTLPPNGSAQLNTEIIGISEYSAIYWEASIAPNNENTSGTGTCPVDNVNSSGSSAVVKAINKTSSDFAKVRVSISADGKTYSDEIYVKVTGSDIISAARYIAIYPNDVVTLKTADGREADWKSTSFKTYLGNPLPKPTASNPVTEEFASANVTVTSNGLYTSTPSIITATADGITDSVYVYVQRGSSTTGLSTVTFDLNGGYGTVPDPVVFSSYDDSRSILLNVPDAEYPEDDGEYVFYGWSEYPDAVLNTNLSANRPIYLPGQIYVMQNSVTLYAIWVKKTENATFYIRTDEIIPAEPSNQPIDCYAKSGIYIEGALNQSAAFYYDVNGVEGHLAKVPSDADIARVLNNDSIPYDPDIDMVVWYVVKRIADDAAGLPNWRVDGVLLKGGKVSLTYDKNIPVANVKNMPNPPRNIFEVDECGAAAAVITDRVPTVSGLSFIGWNTESDGSGQWFSSTGILYNDNMPPAGETVLTYITIVEDTTLYAIWDGSLGIDDEEIFKIDFVNYDGALLKRSFLTAGETPEYRGKTPSRPQTEDLRFIFAGWNPELSEVTGDATYTATYTQVSRFSASISANAVVRGDKLTWDITTPADVTWLKFNGKDESGNAYTAYYKYSNYNKGTTEASVTDTEDGRVWNIPMVFNYAGTQAVDNQTWTIECRVSGSNEWNAVPGDAFKIKVGKNAAALAPAPEEGEFAPYSILTAVSADREENGAEYKYFYITTTDDVSKVKISFVNADTGKTKSATYQTTSTNVVDLDTENGFSVWTIRMKVTAQAQDDAYTVQVRGPAWGEGVTATQQS